MSAFAVIVSSFSKTRAGAVIKFKTVVLSDIALNVSLYVSLNVLLNKLLFDSTACLRSQRTILRVLPPILLAKVASSLCPSALLRQSGLS